MQVVAKTGGITVVDYHSRGMNADFYPRYGPWLRQSLENQTETSASFHTPFELTQMYNEYEHTLEQNSRDEAKETSSVVANSRTADYSVGLLQPGEEERWETFVATHQQGCIYHTLAWKAVTEEGLGHQAYYLRVTDSAGTIVGILPAFLVTGVMGRRLVSVPMRDRGGLLARDGIAASLLIERAKELTRTLNCQYLELRSFDEIDPEVANRHGLHCQRYWVTTRLDLAKGVDALWKALPHSSCRWAIQRARKEGLRCEIDDTEQGMECFYKMFLSTRRKLGIPPYPKEMFRAMWKHLICSGKGNLFIVWKGSEPVDAMLNLHSKDTFITGYAAPQNEWRKLCPNDLMYWSMIEWAAVQGFRHFDFGADSPRQTGLLRFKKKWGGVEHAMSYSHFLNGAKAPPNLDSSSAVFEAVRKVWKVLPIPLGRLLGSWVTRQLS